MLCALGQLSVRQRVVCSEFHHVVCPSVVCPSTSALLTPSSCYVDCRDCTLSFVWMYSLAIFYYNAFRDKLFAVEHHLPTLNNTQQASSTSSYDITKHSSTFTPTAVPIHVHTHKHPVSSSRPLSIRRDCSPPTHCMF